MTGCRRDRGGLWYLDPLIKGLVKPTDCGQLKMKQKKSDEMPVWGFESLNCSAALWVQWMGALSSWKITSIRIRMFHNATKVMTQHHFAMIGNDPFILGDKWTQIMSAKWPTERNRALTIKDSFFLFSFGTILYIGKKMCKLWLCFTKPLFTMR